jgi:hypothetical protein
MALVMARTLTPLAQEKYMYWLANYKLLLISLVLSLGLLGCETVADRVAANQALFDALSPQDQVSVRAGAVKLGFSPQMVHIALGPASQVRETTNADGQTRTWLYQYYYPVYEGERFVGLRYYTVTRGAAQHVIRVPKYRDQYRYETREYLRVIFRKGKVIEIERTQ